MNKIDQLLGIIANLGEELEKMKNLKEEIEKEITEHTKMLVEEVSRLKHSLKMEESNRAKKDMEKQLEAIANDVDETAMLDLEETSESTEKLTDKPLSWNWSQEPLEESEKTPIDWRRELAEREELKTCLTVLKGWRIQSWTHEMLEEHLRSWTGDIKWMVLKKSKTPNDAILMTVKFETIEDARKVFLLQKEIGDKGYLLIGDALTFIERKQRQKMLMTAAKLKMMGKDVIFESKRICVDGVWWKYLWSNGWIVDLN